ncbi:hypothetical protein Csa_014237 [Cucumis sativus]|uniref:Uncharacterized protein n=1 Tax=Cucumis sativus TaxID=3659 RepID=A0A0A0LSL6_CUCSA|nr:hypothetical protein Csa_014237 [Cucumis sativus]
MRREMNGRGRGRGKERAERDENGESRWGEEMRIEEGVKGDGRKASENLKSLGKGESPLLIHMLHPIMASAAF